jgi:hypothetical protein
VAMTTMIKMTIIAEQDMKEREKENEVEKDQKEKKEKICLIFIKQNCNISIHI